MTFFEVNLDYVYFLTGLSLVSLGAVAALLTIERERTLRWPWLAAAGVFGGLTLWAASATLGLGDAPVFGWARFAISVAAMTALFEFGRRSLERLTHRVPGVWLTALLAAAVLASSAFGLDRAASAVRLALGAPGALLAACAVLLAALRLRDAEKGIASRARRVLYGAAAGLAAYGVCLASGGGIVVGTRDAATWFGPVPVQAVAAFAVFVAASELLGYSASQQVLSGDLPALHHAFRRFYAVLIMLVVAVAGGVAVNQAGMLADRAARATLRQRALTAAAALGTEDIGALRGGPADVGTEAYEQILSELEHMHAVNNDIRFMYLMGRVDGRTVILADSAALGPVGVSPPGEAYSGTSQRLKALLGGRGTGFVEGPLRVGSGTWVTAFVPVSDASGVQTAVLGMDVSERVWTLATADYRAMAIALVLVASVLALVAIGTEQVAQDTRQRMAATEARLRKTLTSAPDGIAIVEPASRRIEFANQTLGSMLGIPIEAITGIGLDALMADEGQTADPPAPGADRTTERRILTAGGVTIDAEVTWVPFVVDDADRLLVYVHDVTKRKAAERELQERITLENIVRAVSSRFLSIQATEVDGVVLEGLGALGAVLDVDRVYLGTVTPRGLASRTHEWCSPGTPRQAALVRDVDLTAFPWFHDKLRANEFAAVSSLDDLPDDASADRAIMVSQGVRSRVVIPLVEGDVLSGYLGIDAVREEHVWSGQRIALLTVFADVLSAALRRSQAEAEVAKLTLAVTNSPAATVITDANGAIEYVNPRFQELSGYSAAELIGANPRVLTSGEMPPEVYTELWRVITAGGDWRGELVNRRKDGSHYAVAESISPVRDAKGAVHFVGVQEDITALKVAEEALRSAADIANAANRAKSDFLATMSHEIRTPMNAIIGMGELLEETGLTKDQRRFVRIIRTAGEALLALINDVLDLSKIEAGRFEIDVRPFDVSRMVEETAEVLAIRAREKGLDLIVRIDPSTPRCIEGDPDRLRQVLVNLVGNAVKFTAEGHVLIAVEPDTSSGGSQLRFTVTDTGIGIAEDKLEQIFEAFTQADSSTTRRYGGTGLGLTISRRLAGLMGGVLRATSDLEHGSTFSFAIPLREVADPVGTDHPGAGAEPFIAPDHPSVSAAEPGVDTPVRALDILLVEDTEDSRLLVQAYLKRTPHRVVAAVDGSEAVDAFTIAGPGGFDIVFMDMQMPVMDGYAATRRIREIETAMSWPRTTVIALTAFALAEETEAALKAGCDDYMTKPIRKATLLDAVVRHSGG